MSFLTSFFKREKSLTISHAPDASGFIPMPMHDDLEADAAALQQIMQTNELVFACLNIKAQAARDPHLVVEQRRGQNSEYKIVENHPLANLMRSPNERMTEGDLLTAAMVSWDTTAPRRLFAEKEYMRSLLVGLHPLNPAMMSPIRSGAGQSISGWRWGTGGNTVDYKIDELLIRSAPSWYQPAPLVAALGSISADTGQTDYVRSFLANGGSPSIYLKDTSRIMTTPMRDEIRARWRATYRNQSRQHDIGVLDMTQDIIKIGAGLDEIDNDILRQISESRICMVLGVPPLIVYAYVGLIRATYSNLKEAWAGFWDATMSPTLREWRDFWALSLLPEFEERGDIQSDRVRLRYDMSQVAALQDDVDALQTRTVKSYTAGLLTLNEARSKIGEKPDPTPAGDEYRKAVAPVKEASNAATGNAPADE